MLPEFNVDINNITKQPNKVIIPAAALKTEFDKSGNAIKAYINDTLTKAIDVEITSVNSNTNAHKDDKNNPHEVTKLQVGLGNADNTSDANKPVSTAQQSALNLKVDKVTGKSLISDTEIAKLSNYPVYSEVTNAIGEKS